MKSIHKLLGGNLIWVFLLAGAVQAAEGWTRYNSQPGIGSKVKIEGTSTMHDWLVEGSIIGGYLEIGPNFPVDPAGAKPGKVDAKVDVFIPVRALKSMKDGKPYSNAMDDIMYEKLLEATNKRILYKLTEMTLKEAPKDATGPFLFDTKGDLVVAGATQSISMPVEMKVEGNKLRFSGKVTSKMSDFKIDPPAPAIAGGMIKTGDEIKLSIDWITVTPKKK